MFEQVISILFPVFALVAIGFGVGKTLKTDFVPINRLNMDVFLPALIFSSLVGMSVDLTQLPLLLAALTALLIPGIVMTLCYFTSASYKTWAPSQMFRNSGNLAIPLFGYTFGESATGSAVLLFVVSTTLHIIIASLLLSNNGSGSMKHALKSPVFIAAIGALTWNFSGVPVWEPLHESTQLLGQASIPIMLISLGSQMTKLQRSGLRIGVISSVVSLLTGAVAFTLIYLLIPLPTQQLQMMVLFTMLPPAVMNYLFAERYQTEPHKVASMVLFGNAFSMITLPLLLSLALSIN